MSVSRRSAALSRYCYRCNKRETKLVVLLLQLKVGLRNALVLIQVSTIMYTFECRKNVKGGIVCCVQTGSLVLPSWLL